MPTRTTAPTGAPCWIDLQTSDAAVARSFYPALFGWTAAEASEEFGGYFMFLADGDVPVAGAMPADAQAPVKDVWAIYLSVGDAAKTLDLAREHGGQVAVEPMQVADLGTMAFVIDSGGAAIGMWQPDQFTGFGAVGDVGYPGWFEVYARDYDAVVPFYQDVFGWQTREMPAGPFRMAVMTDPSPAEGGNDMLAGVMDANGFLPEGVPPHWKVYLTVADTDASAAKAVELGGSVIEPAVDTPYGRIAHLADPNGATFKIVGPNDEMPAR